MFQYLISMKVFFNVEKKRHFLLNSIDTTIQPPETTDSIHVEIASMNANRTLKKNDFAINDEVTMIPILYGALISISSFCIAFIIYIIYKKGKRWIFLTICRNPYPNKLLIIRRSLWSQFKKEEKRHTLRNCLFKKKVVGWSVGFVKVRMVAKMEHFGGRWSFFHK